MNLLSDQVAAWQDHAGYDLTYTDWDGTPKLSRNDNDFDCSEWLQDPFSLFTNLGSAACDSTSSPWQDGTDYIDTEHTLELTTADLASIQSSTPFDSPIPSIPSCSSSDREDTSSNTSSRKTRRSRRSRQPGRTDISRRRDQSTSQRAKQMHSAVERRYRDNLNSKFEQLAQALKALDSPSIYVQARGENKTRKCDVLTGALNYIHHSELEIRHMSAEIRQLRQCEQILQKLASD